MAATTTDPTRTALAVCAACGAEMPADAAFCPACGARVAAGAAAAPAPPVRRRSPPVAAAPPATAGPAPAPLLTRGAAFFIDYTLLAFATSFAVGIADGAVGGAAAAIAALAMVAVGQLYWAGLESGRAQASIGKQALKLIVVNLDGTRMTFNRGLVRSALSIAPLFVAYLFIIAGSDILGGLLILFVVPGAVLIAPFNERRQALHDVLTATMVARRPHA